MLVRGAQFDAVAELCIKYTLSKVKVLKCKDTIHAFAVMFVAAKMLLRATTGP